MKSAHHGHHGVGQSEVKVRVMLVVVVVIRGVKILSIKLTHSACTFNYPLNKGKGAIYPHLLIEITEL